MKNIACGFNRRTTSIICNYCVEMDPVHFQMSKKDGKSVLIHSQNAKGFYTLKSPNHISV
ncbi:MAG: hypothetical protein ABIP27_21790 [Flavobacterium circumlabens]|uniref:hypothetical protein n=1 Tax=Flavobacterium circumlabens TaxID=2133765 RepID=UPI003263A799